MKKAILTSFILSALSMTALFMTACSSAGNTESKSDVPAETTAQMTTSVVDSADDTSSVVTDMSTDTSVELDKYDRFYAYMLDNSSDKNSVFSPESLNSSFCIYGALLDEEGSHAVKQFVEDRDYLFYESTDAFKTVNRLWLNSIWETDTTVVDLAEDVIYKIDMSDPSATAEKDKYVSDMTDGFITSTPTVFTKDVLFDAMNVIYFKDAWLNGDKALSKNAIPFHNANGSTTDVNMIEDHADGVVMSSDSACAYGIPYSDGFMFFAVLPNEGKSLSDISINDFVFGTATSDQYDIVNFYMPEFETQSTYTCDLNTFGISAETLNPYFFAGTTDPADITQVAKIKVDHIGTEAAAVTETMKNVTAMAHDDRTSFDFICDRPFAYYIYDAAHDDIAFMGVVTSI